MNNDIHPPTTADNFGNMNDHNNNNNNNTPDTTSNTNYNLEEYIINEINLIRNNKNFQDLVHVGHDLTEMAIILDANDKVDIRQALTDGSIRNTFHSLRSQGNNASDRALITFILQPKLSTVSRFSDAVWDWLIQTIKN